MWEGKYGPDGKRPAPLRVALPFQTVETVNESAQERQRSLALFGSGADSEWRNRLIWGDKKYVLPALRAEFEERIDLVYIDPPFASGQDFSYAAEVGGEDFTKQPSVIEQKAYRDTWGRGLDGYLGWLYDALVGIYELLSPQGSLYLHLDATVSHYAKAVLDEVFGSTSFQREIIWRIGWVSGYKSAAKNWIRNHDVILFYVKSPGSFTFNKPYIPYPAGYERRGGGKPTGAGYPIDDVWNGSPIEHQLAGEESLDSIQIKSFSTEKTGYATQKNESLVRRIILASSNPGDIVADFFCGSGTTAAVAEKCGRRWVVSDLGRFAIHTTRKRLLSIEGVRPFVVQNLGKYERQHWQVDEFGESAEATVDAYRRFILGLYHARPMRGHIWLHGTKAGRMVHVGTVDAPVAPGDVRQIVAEFKRAVGTGKDAPSVSGIDILGWDFAFEMNEAEVQRARKANIDIRLVRIPREVLEKRAVEQGDIKFFELAALNVKQTRKARAVTVALSDFVIPLDDVPDDVRRAVKSWPQWIDYWAVDWSFRDDTFHNEWQSYRTRRDKDIELSVTHEYAEPGRYTIVVKVIDILGNDTTKALTVEVP